MRPVVRKIQQEQIVLKKPYLSCLALCCLSLLFGCKPYTQQDSRYETLPAGTAIEAILMKPLESGVEEEGDQVPLIVAKDVLSPSGGTLVPRGSSISARVAWSRRERTLDGILGRPARLQLRLESVQAADGTIVPLAADASLDPKATVELNRANTSRFAPDRRQEVALDDPKNEQAIRALASVMADGTLPVSADRDSLLQAVDQLGLTHTAKLIREDQSSQVQELVDKAKSGANLASLLTGGSASLALDAILEVAGLASGLPDRFDRALHGRNIKAYIGTPVTAYVAEDARVRL